MKFFKRHVLQQHSYEDLIRKELDEAREDLLRAETAMDWAQSNCDYNYARIERLERRLEWLATKTATRDVTATVSP